MRFSLADRRDFLREEGRRIVAPLLVSAKLHVAAALEWKPTGDCMRTTPERSVHRYTSDR